MLLRHEGLVIRKSRINSKYSAQLIFYDYKSNVIKSKLGINICSLQNTGIKLHKVTLIIVYEVLHPYSLLEKFLGGHLDNHKYVYSRADQKSQ